ncbi:hypothetical protein HELRODRAFT_158846 [Helobdella robusta]|uniref:Uncharacterized protein n=1 Tax=Helobdella robusta TaxID=6412 RepID=T1ENC0_HELRO|nr:hypothetical protein HELRODRAFT_158846 [Helobdella robusta]ESO12342.1 hypothetical protein HELRODRAFT_158846 [Helobdella robusta]
MYNNKNNNNKQHITRAIIEIRQADKQQHDINSNTNNPHIHLRMTCGADCNQTERSYHQPHDNNSSACLLGDVADEGYEKLKLCSITDLDYFDAGHVEICLYILAGQSQQGQRKSYVGRISSNNKGLSILYSKSLNPATLVQRVARPAQQAPRNASCGTVRYIQTLLAIHFIPIISGRRLNTVLLLVTDRLGREKKISGNEKDLVSPSKYKCTRQSYSLRPSTSLKPELYKVDILYNLISSTSAVSGNFSTPSRRSRSHAPIRSLGSRVSTYLRCSEETRTTKNRVADPIAPTYLCTIVDGRSGPELASSATYTNLMVRVPETVTSHAKHLPALQGIMAQPSGRLPSCAGMPDENSFKSSDTIMFPIRLSLKSKCMDLYFSYKLEHCQHLEPRKDGSLAVLHCSFLTFWVQALSLPNKRRVRRCRIRLKNMEVAMFCSKLDASSKIYDSPLTNGKMRIVL